MSEPIATKNPGIIRLTVSNLLRIKAASVEPDGSLVVVAGANDQGKSSLLNSIAIALSGKDLPAMPIRAGAPSGYVILETAELIVTRKFSQTGGQSLEVRDKDGVRVTSPQDKLNALISKTTFDPFAFTRQAPDKQLETLRRVTGLDFTALDTEHKQKYELRTVVNRQVRDQDGALKAIPRDPTAPKEPVSVADLMAQLEEIQKYNVTNAERREALSQLNDDLDEAGDLVNQSLHEISQLQQAIARLEDALIGRRAHAAQVATHRDEMKIAVEALQDKDPAPISEQIKAADVTNAAVRNNAKWQDEHKKFIALQTQSGELTARLEQIEKEKQEKLEKASFPVPGLGFAESGVLYNNVPFEQAGTAVQIRTSIAIARSLNPGLPVMFIRDGSLLDPKSLAIVKEEAETKGLQVWLEVVGDRDDATVVIEDGEVIATAATKAEAKGAKKKK